MSPSLYTIRHADTGLYWQRRGTRMWAAFSGCRVYESRDRALASYVDHVRHGDHPEYIEVVEIPCPPADGPVADHWPARRP